MKYIELIERRQHGSFDFPFAFYDITSAHSRYNMQLHWHKEFEILHVISGNFYLSLDNLHYTLSEGDTAVISGGSLHGGRPENCHYQCLVFDLEFFVKNHCFCADELRAVLLHEQTITPYFSSGDSFVMRCCEGLFSAIQTKASGWQLSFIGSMCSLLGYFLQQNCFINTSSFALKNKKKIKQFKTVLSFISEHYTEKLTLAQLAGSIPMNKNYFCHFFQELTGCTPMEYVNYYRIESACEQLAATDKSITEIAMDCGFSDTSYFIKIFRSYKAQTPRQYLKSLARPN